MGDKFRGDTAGLPIVRVSVGTDVDIHVGHNITGKLILMLGYGSSVDSVTATVRASGSQYVLGRAMGECIDEIDFSTLGLDEDSDTAQIQRAVNAVLDFKRSYPPRTRYVT